MTDRPTTRENAPLATSGRSGPTSLGRLLHRYRMEAELTQEELAERAGLSARAVSDLERGAKTRPHLSTVGLLADALDLPAEERAALIAALPSRARVHDGAVRFPDLPISGFLGSLPEGRLVARDRELEQIVKAVEEVLQGAGRLVLLAGEPGVGKTRLAQEVTVALRNRGFLLAAGRCYEPQQAMPLYPLQTALSALYGLAPSGIQDRATDRWPYLAPLLSDHVPSVPSAQGGDQQALFRAAASFLRAAAETAPVAILLDDLHWLDTVSLDLLLHLARETRSDRVFLLATYRDAEVGRGSLLARAFLDLERERLAERIAVRRLKEEGTSALIASALGETTISPAFAELIYRRTNGNPFFVQQVLRMLVEQGDLYRRDGKWGQREIADIEVPEGIRALIGQRLSHLRDETQEILHEASVLGQTFLFDDLQAMTQRSEDAVDAALEEARAVALVKEAGRDSYAFDHALTQQALCAALSPRRRRKLHLAAGEALERLPERKRDARVVELAWHFLEADDSERAVVYALRAGDQAEGVFAHEEAEQQYRTALELAQERGDERRVAEATEKVGRLLGTTGRYDDALTALERAAALHREAARVEGEAQALAALGWVHADRGTADDAIERLRSFLHMLSESHSQQTRASLLVTLARLHFVAGQYVEAAEAGEQASLLARAADDKQMLIQAERRRLGALGKLGQLYDQMGAYEELRRVAEAVGDLHTLCSVFNSLGDIYHIHRDKDRSTLCRSRAVEVAERLGDPSQIAFMTSKLGWNAYETGDWPQARTLLERALETARSSGSSWAEPYALWGLGLLYVAAGDWEQASGVLEDCIAQCTRTGDLQAHRHAAWAAADKRLLEGRPDLVPAHLRPILDRPGLEESDVTLLLPYLAQAHLDMGDWAQAESLAAEAVRRARAANYPDALIDSLRVQGMVLAGNGGWEAATASLEEALGAARDIKNPYMEARALYELGRMYAQKREPAAALRRLEQALAIFRRLGARPYIERTEQALAAID